MSRPGRINASLQADLEQQPDFRRALLDAGAEAKARANEIAESIGAGWMPRKGGTRETVVLQPTDDGARLVNTDHGGHLMEWGSKNNPPHAPLRRGVRAAGLRLEEI